MKYERSKFKYTEAERYYQLSPACRSRFANLLRPFEPKYLTSRCYQSVLAIPQRSRSLYTKFAQSRWTLLRMIYKIPSNRPPIYALCIAPLQNHHLRPPLDLSPLQIPQLIDHSHSKRVRPLHILSLGSDLRSDVECQYPTEGGGEHVTGDEGG